MSQKNIHPKENFGITLVALVITIVVLIILAGVLINISLGNNGLFNKAKTAKEKYTNAQDYEETEIAKMTNNIDKYSTFTRAGGSNINYSLQEQDTSLKWTDRKKIYQKTIATTVTLEAGKWINTSLDSSSIDRLIDIYAYQSNGTVLKCLNASIDNETIYIYLANANDLQISHITFQYTKTTD